MRRILVVTDDATLAEAMEALLATHGHEVETASDVAGALERGRTFRPTMALIDVDLGGGPNGHEVARQLRAMLGRSVVLVVHTGYGPNEVRRAARAARFDAYLPKPFDLADLDRLPTESRPGGVSWVEMPQDR
jgi:CheY-like chemotaxis protein